MTRRAAFSSGAATFSLGALYGRSHFELTDDESGQTLEFDGSNPGAFLGVALDFPSRPASASGST